MALIKGKDRLKFVYDGADSFDKKTKDWIKENIEQYLIPFPLLGDTYPQEIKRKWNILTHLQIINLFNQSINKLKIYFL